MARWIDAWLPGAAGPAGPAGPAAEYPGERFGLPREGVNAVAGFGRRLAAITLDWTAASVITLLVRGTEGLVDPASDPKLRFVVLLVWFLLTAVPVAVFGATAGMTALGIRVASLDSAAVIGVPRALLRTLMIALIIPPLARDGDGRGWHDRATRTVVVRTR